MLACTRRNVANVFNVARRSMGTMTATSPVSLPVTLSEVAPDFNISFSQDPVYLELATPLIPKSNDVSPENNVLALDPTVFRHPIRRDILHLCVTHYRDSLRQGTASTKTRGEVRGSGIKIRPQKGSGKARLGDGQSPMLRGGGIAFGPKPRDFSTKLPRKVIEMGMRVALSAKVKEQKLAAVSRLGWPSGKTRHLSHRIDNLGWRKTLFVTGEEEIPAGLERAMRNIPSVRLTSSDKLTVYDIVKWPRLVMDLKALEYFEKTLCKQTGLVA
ncbi:universal ribosomal protein uL4 family protein [Pleurotus pulmonarius]|nr:54S ribosomal protein, mitochondrial [Pleurotus pulmonarius]